MEKLLSIWRELSSIRKGLLVGSVLTVAFAIGLIAKLSSAPNFVLLYAGLDPRAAGEVMASLDGRALEYQVRGDSIYVDRMVRDQLRMSLAAEDLPPQNNVGYELLDQLSGYSTTSQMFDVTYWRAKEGELARTILTVPDLRAARVHIGRGPNSVFQRDAKVTASVTVTSGSAGLSQATATALRHLVASSVAGLQPSDVQIIDTAVGLLGAEGGADNDFRGTAQTRAKEIRQGIERLLAARVGQGAAVVEVSVDLDTQSEMISERLIDPNARVAISAETQERSEQNTESSTAVGVASNLPDPQQNGQGQSRVNELRERINYEVSQTNREVSRAAGSIKRLTLAVLIDGQTQFAEDGTVIKVPRSAEELASLRELVASASGFDESRGDVLTLESMDFMPLPELGSAPPAPTFSQQIDIMTLAKIVTAAMVILGLGYFVIRPIFMSVKPMATILPEVLPPALPMAQTADFSALLDSMGDGEQSSSFQLSEEEPSNRLRRLIGERQSETIEVLRNWLEPEEEKA